MKTSAVKISGLIAIAIMLLALTVFSFLTSFDKAVGSAPSGAINALATSSVIAVGPQAVTTLFGSTTMPLSLQACSNRVISTVSQPIMLSFNPDVVPSALSGHIQAASTTVTYDSGLYGCGLVQAYGFNASTTITRSEFK